MKELKLQDITTINHSSEDTNDDLLFCEIADESSMEEDKEAGVYKMQNTILFFSAGEIYLRWGGDLK